MSHNKQLGEIPISVLDLSPIVAGSTPSESFQNTVNLARHAEKWGYHRYWLAEHHNMPFIASSATSVVIGQVAAATSKIRVGSGGIMLPNYAPLVISTVQERLQELLDDTQVNEIMAIAQVFDHQARIRSYEILSEIAKINLRSDRSDME